MTHADRLLTLCLSTLLLAGCARNQSADGDEKAADDATTRSGQDDTLEDAIRRGARNAGDATANAVTDVKEGAQRAAEATSEALDEAGQRAAAAARTVDVKTALMADERVDASRINVDSEYGARIVHLRGAVESETEKRVAALIAVEKSPGWKVSNELIVTPKL